MIYLSSPIERERDRLQDQLERRIITRTEFTAATVSLDNVERAQAAEVASKTRGRAV